MTRFEVWLCGLINGKKRGKASALPTSGRYASQVVGKEIPWHKLKVGLVLNGGGAKGAYQVGCLKVLTATGIRFSCVAGSSVGALNGALVAAGKAAAVEHLWNELTFGKVIGITLKNLVYLPIWLVFAAYVRRFGPPSSRHPDPLWRPIILLFGFVMTVALTVLSYQQHVLGEMFLFILLGIVGTLSEAEVVSRVLLAKMLTNNEPLRGILRKYFSEDDHGNLKALLLVTLSRLRPWAEHSMSKGGWTPDYIEVNKCGYDDAQQILLQSAGLPGVFPVRKVFAEDAVDGGFTDNSPTAPLLYWMRENLDLIFVIHLQPKEENDIGDSKEHARFMWKTFCVSQLKKEQAVNLFREYRDDQLIDYYAPPKMPPPQLIEIFPSQSLGNFVTGTLNFCPEKISYLIKLGETDTTALLTNLTEGTYRGTAPNKIETT